MTNWIKAGNAAVITGGASGIGLAAARHYLSAGMRVLIADSNKEALTRAAESLTSHGELYADVCDVSDFEQVKALADTAREKLGDISCLMNNAGASLTPSAPWENLNIWKKQVEINLWGIVHGCQAFIPAMLESGVRGAVINTGSKQGITNPPGGY